MKVKTGLRRDTTDKFYTKPSTVNICLQAIREHNLIGHNDLVIEPSAGNGAFMDGIRSITAKCVFYDLIPEHSDVIQQDYLEYTPPHENSDYHYSKIHIIGNPPFGRQSSKAIQFIRKSAEFSNSISFILPKSFQKESMQKYFPLNFHLVKQIELSNDSFYVGNTIHNVPTVFQIWVKQDFPRTVKPRPKPSNHYCFVKKDENPTIAIRRVGVYAGKVFLSTVDKSSQSHYFIYLDESLPIEEIVEKFNQVVFHSSTYTVGPKSISKSEMIEQYNCILSSYSLP